MDILLAMKISALMIWLSLVYAAFAVSVEVSNYNMVSECNETCYEYGMDPIVYHGGKCCCRNGMNRVECDMYAWSNDRYD